MDKQQMRLDTGFRDINNVAKIRMVNGELHINKLMNIFNGSGYVQTMDDPWGSPVSLQTAFNGF